MPQKMPSCVDMLRAVAAHYQVSLETPYKDLPEDFNYDEVIRKEFGAGPKRGGLKTVWWLAAIVLIIVFIVIYFYAAR